MSIESKLKKAGVVAVGGLAFLTAYFAPDYNKGFNAYAGGDPESIKQVSPADKKLAEKNNALGNLFFSAGKYQKAIDFFEKARDNDPNAASNYGMLAECYIAQGENLDEARELAVKALNLSDDPQKDAHNYARIAQVDSINGQCETALINITKYESYYQANGGLNSSQELTISNVRDKCK